MNIETQWQAAKAYGTSTYGIPPHSKLTLSTSPRRCKDNILYAATKRFCQLNSNSNASLQFYVTSKNGDQLLSPIIINHELNLMRLVHRNQHLTTEIHI